MKTLETARALAETMISLGRQAGREVVCLLTDMDQPLGAAVGNALEVREALETVRGQGPADFTEVVLDACAKLLSLSDLGIDEAEGRRRAEAAVADGSAEVAWCRWLEAQGGTSDESALPVAPVIRAVASPRAGYVRELGAIAIGNAAMHLGAGRLTKDDASITQSASSAARKRGTRVDAGEVLARFTPATEADADEAVRGVLSAYQLGDGAAGRAPRAARGGQLDMRLRRGARDASCRGVRPELCLTPVVS